MVRLLVLLIRLRELSRAEQADTGEPLMAQHHFLAPQEQVGGTQLQGCRLEGVAPWEHQPPN